jgi:uridine kinase
MNLFEPRGNDPRVYLVAPVADTNRSGDRSRPRENAIAFRSLNQPNDRPLNLRTKIKYKRCRHGSTLHGHRFVGCPGLRQVDAVLRELPSAKILSYDRFHPRMSNVQVEDWLKRGGDPNEMALENLVAALKDLTLGAGDGTRSPILFETAFGRAHRASGAFINFSVWIDTPLDIAMSRVTRVFLRNAELDPSPTAAADLIPRLSRYMQDYPMLRRMYVRVAETGKASADLVVDGTPPAEEIATQIAIALADRGISA